MTTKEAFDILVACSGRTQLKAALHKHFGFSVEASRAIVRQWLDTAGPAGGADSSDSPAPAKNGDLTRAGVARIFRDAREKELARLQFIQDHVRPQVLEAARQMPVPPRITKYFDGTVRSHQRADTAQARETWWESTVQPRVVAEIVERLDACKDRDQLEAELVRLGWPEDAIAEYMEDYAPRK